VFPTAAPDIDRILEAIRSEASARGARGRMGAYSTDLPPTAAGAAHRQRGLLRGRMTRIEVLGRLAFSPEGIALASGTWMKR
jgi:hypothetical protein